MPTFMQRVRLALAGWRRRSGEAEQRKRDFVASQANWGAAPGTAPAPVVQGEAAVDFEGLQVAFLDDSGALRHFLDLETGEVLDFPSSDRESYSEMLRDPRRYRSVPRRSAASDATDRRLFVETVEREDLRLLLWTAIQAADAASEFRRALARDRAAERAWYNFKNDRAMRAIEEWLQSL